MKYILLALAVNRIGRAPHGARGLKFSLQGVRLLESLSRPTRGAWIEISLCDG